MRRKPSKNAQCFDVGVALDLGWIDWFFVKDMLEFAQAIQVAHLLMQLTIGRTVWCQFRAKHPCAVARAVRAFLPQREAG